jgi:hypothetical protein
VLIMDDVQNETPQKKFTQNDDTQVTQKKNRSYI